MQGRDMRVCVFAIGAVGARLFNARLFSARLFNARPWGARQEAATQPHARL